jgi:LuxR family maltose regulon positive regulatory protein
LIALTERERTVISLAAEGLTRQEIGDELAITVHGVDTHLGSIYCKLGARNIAHAVALVTNGTRASPSM